MIGLTKWITRMTVVITIAAILSVGISIAMLVVMLCRLCKSSMQEDHRPSEASWLGCDPQAGEEDMATGGSEGAC